MNIAELQPASENVGTQNIPIPVTILTGFLGSGKTTALNHILNCDHGLKVAVIVNEFGSISIDDKLISNHAENIIELANGCICCSMQGDLLKALYQVLDVANDINYILLETSGLADPSPIAMSLLNKDLGNAVRLDGIITMVDALNFDSNLEYAEVAFSQLVNGDLILINKVDLVEEKIPELIQQGIRKINQSARMLSCVNGEIDPYLLLDLSLSKAETYMSNLSAHKHDISEFDSISFESERPIDQRLFSKFMTEIPSTVFRGKGVLNVVDDDSCRIFHLVGDRCVVTEGRKWLNNEKRKSQLIFIGRELNESRLLSKLSSCLT